jgi:hypothetical protein
MPAQWHIDLADLLLAQSETVAENQAFARTDAIQKQQRLPGNMLDGTNQSAQVGLVYAAVALL